MYNGECYYHSPEPDLKVPCVARVRLGFGEYGLLGSCGASGTFVFGRAYTRVHLEGRTLIIHGLWPG